MLSFVNNDIIKTTEKWRYNIYTVEDGLPIKWSIVANGRDHDDIVSSQLPYLLKCIWYNINDTETTERGHSQLPAKASQEL